MTDLDAQVKRMFLNRLRSLFNIDSAQLPELSASEWPRFRDDPVKFLMRAGDAQTDAIWREVERRQRLTLHAEPAMQAAE
jgi:hypothetical protein